MSALTGLHRLSIGVMLAGIVVLYVASVQYAPPRLTVDDVSTDRLGEVVHVTGNVSRYAVQDGTTFMTLSGSGDDVSLPVVSFRPVEGVARYQRVTIEGRVSLYRGELELIMIQLLD